MRASPTALKRGGGHHRLPLLELSAENGAEIGDLGVDLLDLHEALEELERVSPRIARVVELRFLAGMTAEEVAAELGVTERSVFKDWRVGRAMLRRQLAQGEVRGRFEGIPLEGVESHSAGYSAAFSPDGMRVALTRLEDAHVYDVLTGRRIATIAARGGRRCVRRGLEPGRLLARLGLWGRIRSLVGHELDGGSSPRSAGASGPRGERSGPRVASLRSPWTRSPPAADVRGASSSGAVRYGREGRAGGSPERRPGRPRRARRKRTGLWFPNAT